MMKCKKQLLTAAALLILMGGSAAFTDVSAASSPDNVPAVGTDRKVPTKAKKARKTRAAGEYRPFAEKEAPAGLPARFRDNDRPDFTPERRQEMKKRAGGTYRAVPRTPEENGPKGKKEIAAVSPADLPRRRAVNDWQENHKKDDGRFDKDFRHEKRDNTFRADDPYDTDHTPRIRDEKERTPRRPGGPDYRRSAEKKGPDYRRPLKPGTLPRKAPPVSPGTETDK